MKSLELFHWLGSLKALVMDSLGLVAVVGAALLLTILIKRATRRVEARIANETTPLRNLQRAHTLSAVTSSTGIMAIWVLTGLILLSLLGLDVGGVFAGVGLAGLAIGLGAQDLIKDFLAGFFIILEDRYGVGDIVRVNGTAAGRVEQLSLRVTGLRDLDGTLWYINNGEIKEVANLSKQWSGALVDIPIAHSEEPTRVRRVLERVAGTAMHDPELRRKLRERPRVLGVEAVDPFAATWRILAHTRPGQQWDVARGLREMAMAALLEEGIKLPRVPPEADLSAIQTMSAAQGQPSAGGA